MEHCHLNIKSWISETNYLEFIEFKNVIIKIIVEFQK